MDPAWGRGPRILALGARGLAVRTLQEELARLGFDPGPIDGRYGLLTRQAVRECQRRYGLLADGVAGPNLLRLLREPALRLGRTQAILGVVDPARSDLERWHEAYPFLSALVWPSTLGRAEPGAAVEAWSDELARAGAGTRRTPPWVWRIARGPGAAEEGEGRTEEEGGAPDTFTPKRRVRRELVRAILKVVDRFRPLAVDLELEPVLPGDGHRWIALLASLRTALERRGLFLLATRDVNRRLPLWPRWADDLPNRLLLQNVHLLTLAGRPCPGLRPPGGIGAAALRPLLAGIKAAQAYKVMVEVPLGAARWRRGPDHPMEGPETLPYQAARVEAMRGARRLRWDGEAGAMTFRLRRGPVEEEYWLASSRSVDQVLRGVAVARLAGIVVTPLGFEDPRARRAFPGPLTPWRPTDRDGADIPPAAGA